MLEIKFIRENKALVEGAVRQKGMSAEIEAILKLDEERRKTLAEVEELRRQRNEVSERISRLKKEGKETSGLVDEMRVVADRIKELDEILRQTEAELENLLVLYPTFRHQTYRKGRPRMTIWR